DHTDFPHAFGELIPHCWMDRHHHVGCWLHQESPLGGKWVPLNCVMSLPWLTK
ncbi:hypothetical protein Ancab_008193, partial [Ancistrocladus abbreviatus]